MRAVVSDEINPSKALRTKRADFLFSSIRKAVHTLHAISNPRLSTVSKPIKMCAYTFRGRRFKLIEPLIQDTIDLFNGEVRKSNF